MTAFGPQTSAPAPARRRPIRWRVDNASDAVTVLRDRAWETPDMQHFLETLHSAGAEDLTLLKGVARNSITYQSGNDHLATRRALATVLSPAAVALWQPALDTAIESAMVRLAESDTPDLVRDFSDPLFVGCAREIIGLTIDDEASFLTAIHAARVLTEPLLAMRQLLDVQRAFGHLIGAVPGQPGPGGSAGAGTLAALLSDLPPGIDQRMLIASVTVAAHTAAESLSFALWGLLRGGPQAWRDVAAPGWATTHLDEVIRDFPSTLTLWRTAKHDTVLRGEVVMAGDLLALDVPAINRSLCPHGDDAPSRRLMSFGDGIRKCPGAALARLILGRALPALAKRFPDLAIDEGAARFERTAMVQAPVALPCTGVATARRRTPRLWQVSDAALARAIAIDDETFGPPALEPHLRKLQAASGEDFSTTIRVARNALFFQSGERHARIRAIAFQALGGNRLPCWQPMIDAEVTRAINALAESETPDLVADFCIPLFRKTCQRIVGLVPRDPAAFDGLTPALQEALEPLRSLRAIRRIQRLFDELLSLIDTPYEKVAADDPPSLMAQLEAAADDDFDVLDRRTIALVLYGASFNVAHTLANVLHQLLAKPNIAIPGDAAELAKMIDGVLIPTGASPRFIYRVARRSGEIGGMRFAEGDTMQLVLAEINRDLGPAHLAFGHGLHRCVGASLSRLIVRRAIPALFARFPDLRMLEVPPIYSPNSQTVILSALPVVLTTSSTKAR